jgi:hypothetical protein
MSQNSPIIRRVRNLDHGIRGKGIQLVIASHSIRTRWCTGPGTKSSSFSRHRNVDIRESSLVSDDSLSRP